MNNYPSKETCQLLNWQKETEMYYVWFPKNNEVQLVNETNKNKLIDYYADDLPEVFKAPNIAELLEWFSNKFNLFTPLSLLSKIVEELFKSNISNSIPLIEALAELYIKLNKEK
jgi:hypothetical protein